MIQFPHEDFLVIFVVSLVAMCWVIIIFVMKNSVEFPLYTKMRMCKHCCTSLAVSAIKFSR